MSRHFRKSPELVGALAALAGGVGGLVAAVALEHLRLGKLPSAAAIAILGGAGTATGKGTARLVCAGAAAAGAARLARLFLEDQKARANAAGHEASADRAAPPRNDAAGDRLAAIFAGRQRAKAAADARARSRRSLSAAIEQVQRRRSSAPPRDPDAGRTVSGGRTVPIEPSHTGPANEVADNRSDEAGRNDRPLIIKEPIGAIRMAA